MSNLKSLVKDTAIYGLSSIVGRFLNYLLVPLYTIKISAVSGGYGVITNLYAYTALFLVLLTYGMETTFFRFANKSGENPQRVYSTILLSVGFTSALFIAMVVLFLHPIAQAMGYADHPSYIWVMAATVAIDAFQCIPFAYLRYQKRPIKFAALKLLFVGSNISLNLIYYLLLPALYEGGHQWVSLIYSPNVGAGYAFYINLVCTACITFCFYKELRGFSYVFDKALLKRMLSYSWPILVLGIAGILNQTADKILFPYIYKGSDAHTQLGIYGAASKIAMIMAMITQAFRYAYEPFVFGKSKDKDNRDTYAKAMKYFIIFTRHFPPSHRSRLLGGIACCAHRYGCRNHDGRVLQPLVLVQAYRQNHLGCLLLRHRLRRAHRHQRVVCSALWLHGLCLGGLCRLCHGHDS